MTPPETPTVLIVSEAPAELGPLPGALERHGLRVRLETSADAAIAALADGAIAAALVETRLRQRDGFEICSLINTSASTRHIPVFLLAPRDDPAERLRGARCGAIATFAKPPDCLHIVETILARLDQAPAGLHALEVNYHQLMMQSPDAVMLFDFARGKSLYTNPSACSLFGLPEHELMGKTIGALCPPFQPDGQPSEQLFKAHVEDVQGGAIRVFEASFLHASGRVMACELRIVLMPTPNGQLIHVRLVDITERRLADQLRMGQGHLLEMIARGAPLIETLDELMLLIESQSSGVYCSVLLLDDDCRSVRPISGPSLPESYMAALDGLQIGPQTGSCGTAMYLKDTVIVADIANDPLWENYRDLVEPYGLRACWSTPIYLNREHVLGSFAMYYRELRSPGPDDMRLIAVATHLAGIAIERTRREHELSRHREHLEVLVDARTAELTRTNQELAATLDSLSLAQGELVRRDKLSALGALVAGVAHELNTPIGNGLIVATTMSAHLDDLSASLAGGLRRSTLDTYLSRTEKANELLVRNLQRAAALVASFKELAVDHASAQRRPFSLSQILADMAPPLRSGLAGRAITLALEVEPELFMESYPGPLAQSVMSLFDNCLTHAFDGAARGEITISASARARGLVAISVIDNGAGIAEAVQARVYDPFFTTKLGSGGSGLGLHLVHNIVTGILGGRIELHSTPGQGTRFTLLLPSVAPQTAPQIARKNGSND